MFVFCSHQIGSRHVQYIVVDCSRIAVVIMAVFELSVYYYYYYYFLFFYFFKFKTRGKPLVSLKLEEVMKSVWKWTLLWPVIINEIIIIVIIIIIFFSF